MLSKAVFPRCKDLPKDYDEITLRSTPLSRFLGAKVKSKVRRFGADEILPKGEKGCEQ